MSGAASLATTQASFRRSGLALAALGAIGFSGKAIIAKLAYRHGVDAITVVMLRMLFALPMFVLLAWWAGRGKSALTGRDLRVIAGLGFCGYYLASTLDFAGLQYISASFERLILYLNPTLVLLLGVVWFKHKVVPRQLWAMALSYCGVVLVFGHELQAVGEHAVLGAALVFGSAVSYAVYLAFSGNEVKRIGAMRLTGWATAVACVLCLVQFVVLRPMSAALVPTPVLWLSLLNATVCTFAPVLMVMMAIERVGATMTAQTGMIGPLSTILLGVVFLGEPLNAWIVGGTVLVLLGVWLLAKARPVSPAPA
jgi:drug/metabolite transporter (DMT)-like permease